MQTAEPLTALIVNDIDKEASSRSNVKEWVRKSPTKPNIFAELSASTSCTQFIERIHALLDQLGASDELLEIWAIAETRSLCPGNLAALHRSCLHHARVPAHGSTRRLAIQLLYEIVSMCFEDDREEKLMKAIVLLDAYCANKESESQTTTLPIFGAALVRLVAKQESNWEKKFAGFASKLMHYLRGTSSSRDELITNQGITAMEVHIMEALRGRLSLPTVQEWIALVSVRLNIFTGSKFEGIIMDIRRCSTSLVPSLIYSNAITSDCTPRRVAQGLLVLMCGQFRVLPSHLFNASEVLSLQPRPTPCQVCSKDQLVFLVALEHASQSSRAALQRDAQVVESSLARLWNSTYFHVDART
jgi:hypothetical protein